MLIAFPRHRRMQALHFEFSRATDECRYRGAGRGAISLPIAITALRSHDAADRLADVSRIMNHVQYADFSELYWYYIRLSHMIVEHRSGRFNSIEAAGRAGTRHYRRATSRKCTTGSSKHFSSNTSTRPPSFGIASCNTSGNFNSPSYGAPDFVETSSSRQSIMPKEALAWRALPLCRAGAAAAKRGMLLLATQREQPCCCQLAMHGAAAAAEEPREKWGYTA